MTRRTISRRCLMAGGAVASAMALLPRFASAQAVTPAWPSRSLRIIVPFPAGGSADVSARLLADHLRAEFGQPVVVESKVGAGGNLAAAEAARAEADGHTLFIGTNGTQTINQSLYSKIPYDPQKDFAAVAFMWQAPQLIVVHPSVQATTLSEFVAFARANPGKLSYGSSGIGSSTQLSGEMFKARAGIDLAHIPYRGQGPALTDLVAGQIQVMFPIVSDVLTHIRAGTVRTLATAATTRVSTLPEVPTTAEAGYPDVLASAWTGLYVPAQTPAPVLKRLSDATERLLAAAPFRERMNQLGIEVRSMAPAEFDGFMQDERSRWAKVIGDLRIKID